MKRRDLLKATGLVAAIDFETVGQELDGGSVNTPQKEAYDEFLDRLPPLSRTPGGEYDATFAKRLSADLLTEPKLFDGYDVHATLVSPRATLTIGLGSASGDGVDQLAEHGYSRSGDIADRPLHIRRDRHKSKLAVIDGETLLVGIGAEQESVAAVVSAAVESPTSRPLHEINPAVEKALHYLGSGTVLTLSQSRLRSRIGHAPGDGEPCPRVTGERLSLRDSEARFRTVAVYRTRADRIRACRGSEPSPESVGDINLTANGRALVTDWIVPESALPLASRG